MNIMSYSTVGSSWVWIAVQRFSTISQEEKEGFSSRGYQGQRY